MTPSTLPLPTTIVLERVLRPERTFLVRDTRSGELFVLRVCIGPRNLVERRITALRATRSRWIVPERELLELGGRVCTLRPWVEGQSLQSGSRGEASTLVDALAAALAPLHERGVAHGRLHPGNLIVDEQGRTVLVDAADTSPAATCNGALYAAPEVLRGEVATVRSDVHAAGLIVFASLTGRPAFAGEPWLDLVHRALYEDVQLPFRDEVSLPTELVRALRRALSRDPAERFASLEAFARELRGAPAAEAARRRPRVSLRLPRAVVAAVVPLAAIGVGMAVLKPLGASRLEQEVSTLIEQKEFRTARQRLAEAQRENGDTAEIEKLLGDVSCAEGADTPCLEHYARALDMDSDFTSDVRLRENTLGLMDRADRQWRVARVAAQLEGVEDVLLSKATHEHYWVRWNAVRALEKRGSAADVPYGVVYGLDVLHAGTCETRRSSLRKLVQLGDPAALPYLEQARARADAKLFGDFCLGGDLSDAIGSLRSGAEERAQNQKT